ncbi:MAG: hypothetical protein Q4D56_12895, partial [Bacteroides sp.]|nr:hypothetical protein [Bacteroides sp.]
LKRNMKEAIDYFVKHAFTYDNLNSILTLHDAKQYFANYVRQGKQTSKRLEEHLLLHEKLTGYTDNQPQSYEDIIDGKRSYLGSFIPDYAPPRPNANSFWHDELRRWIE